MIRNVILLESFFLSLALCGPVFAQVGFVEETVVTGLTEPVGIAFASDDRMLVWEKPGRVWIIDDGKKLPEPLLEIEDEVNIFWTRGMTGLALDPDYENNGYIYLMYTVDWEYYITDGNPDPGNLDTIRDTFGRLVRYTSDPTTNFTTILPDSRWVMIGETHDTGFPVTFASHTQNSLLFSSDGTMLISAGDGASMLETDIGGPRNGCCSSNTAEQDGILPLKEQVGAFRSQLVDSHSGKILRIDPTTAEGLPSNPFYDAKAPSAPRSRVWAMGLRNPFTFDLRPGTGSADPNDGNPGVIAMGDVGWDSWERLIIVTEPGQNLGWPVFEGIEFANSYPQTQVANLDAPNPLFDGDDCTHEFFFFTELVQQESLNDLFFKNTCDPAQAIPDQFTFEHSRAALAWRNSRVFFTPQSIVPIFDEFGNADEVDIDDPDSPVEGQHMKGVATIGGIFYGGDIWPEEYQGSFFFADGVDGWIRVAELDDEHRLVAIREFAPPSGVQPTWLQFDPEGRSLYYTHHNEGFAGLGQIRRLSLDCNDNNVPDHLDQDLNGNGIPDDCDQAGDLDGDGVVGSVDLIILLGSWGRCVDCDACLADLNEDCVVGTTDLLLLLGNWG